MFTHRQRSFVADVRPKSGGLQFLGVLHNKRKILEDTWYVVARTSNHYEDHAHLFGYATEPQADAVRLYFRHTERGYVLYVRKGRYFGHVIARNRHGHYGAYPGDGSDRSRFWMFSEEGHPITGTELIYNDTTITLGEVDGYPVGLSRHKDTEHVYLGDDYTQGLALRISLVERNAAYLAHPDER